MPDSQGNVWFRIGLQGSTYVYEIIYYYKLSSKEGNGSNKDNAKVDEKHVKSSKEGHDKDNVKVDVNANEKLVKYCGELPLYPGDQVQVHRFLCRVNADEIYLHKVENVMIVNEILVTGKCKFHKFSNF